MILSACEQELSEHLQAALALLGFDRTGTLSFLRTTPVGGQTLRFGGRIDGSQRCQISGTAGIIFHSVARVLLGGGALPDALPPTVLVPLHLLHADRQHFEWTMTTPKDAPVVALAVLQEVTSFALPFFERIKSLEDLKRALESQDPVDWFVLTPEQRVLVLASIDYVSGSAEKAVRLLDQALAVRANEPPKRRYLLERLRSQLAAQPTSTDQET